MQICQITGYKHSGKTTIMSALIRYFSDKGFQVGSVKHHGHGGDPDMVEGTDSGTHLESGSVISGVQGETVTQLSLTIPLGLDGLINLYQQWPLDLLLVEGYKQADYPKIVLLRNEADRSLLEELSAIIAVGTWDGDGRWLNDLDMPVFDMNQLEKHISALAERIRREM
ncbi:molybdopterin-guanine dinucleotide biosynthesis protein B [Lentibacillus halophilus]|uniref:Molybdopterin-guanine dinucleotide biosynthesis protein B n=1 Tax=Lentibacillus halophilus TaxID=295065 RepID=A0ABN0Z527_9BACI